MNSVDVREEAAELDDLDFIYELKRPVGMRPVFYFLGGALLFGLAMIVFLLNLLVPPERSSFPMMIGATVVPTLGAIVAVAAGIALMRSPRRVTVGPKELVVEGDNGIRRWNWNEIGWATIGLGTLNYQKQLTVYDVRGKKLVTLGTAFEDFDGLAESIKAEIDRKPDDTAQRVQSRKAKKTGLLMILGSFAFLALGITNAFMALNEKRDAERLAVDGVKTSAAIVRHYLYNVTPRIEYSFTTPEGEAITRDTMMTQADWAALDGEETVPVRYVPADPDNNRLVVGEIENEHGSPTVNLLIAIAVGGMALLFLGVGVMQWTGWDIDFDSKTGKVSIQRFGAGR